MKTRAKKKPAKDRYLELIQYVPLRPIRNEKELDEAINMVDYLVDLRDRREWSQDEKDYLDVLADLVEKYEETHYKFERSSPSQMLAFLIDAKGVTQTQTAKDCRIAESTISELLAGTRKMNRNHIAKLSAYFHVGPGVFFDE